MMGVSAMRAFLVDNRTDGAFPVDITITESHGKTRLVIGRKGVELMTLAIDTNDLTDGIMQAVIQDDGK